MSQSEIRLLQMKADKYDSNRDAIEKYLPVWSALDNVVNAWEKLGDGQSHTPQAVERWLREELSPAINRARLVLGRKAPHATDHRG